MNWYAAQTRYRYERTISDCCARSNIETFVPWVEESRRWNDRKVFVSLPLIGGFVFVREEPAKAVVRMAGFLRWIMFNHQPGIVTEEEIETMKLACRPEFKAKPEVSFQPGSIVMVTRGPFYGRTGIVVSQGREFVRLRMGIGEIGGFSVQVPVEDVQ